MEIDGITLFKSHKSNNYMGEGKPAALSLSSMSDIGKVYSEEEKFKPSVACLTKPTSKWPDFMRADGVEEPVLSHSSNLV